MNTAVPSPTSSSGHPVGLIGLGLMGSVLSARLLDAGATVVGLDLSDERSSAFAASGGIRAAGIVEVFRACDRVLLSLPSHETVSEVLQIADRNLRAGQIVIDTSTGDPEAAVAQAARLGLRGIEYLDATVSGSSEHLRMGTAVFLVGGTDVGFHACRDVFESLASKIFHTGPAGSGARMKLVTNLVLGLNRAALAEGLWLARLLGLDPEQSLLLLRESASYSRIMDTKGEKMLQGDFTPQAKLSQHLKDVLLMIAAARDANASLPLTETHRELLQTAMQLGLGELDNSAILKAIEVRGRATE